MLPARAGARARVERMGAGGAADGITGECALSVDGMPLETSLDMLDELRDIALNGAESRFAPAPAPESAAGDEEAR